MSRNTDMRIYLGKVFPRATLNDNVVFIKNILDTLDQSDVPLPDHFVFKGGIYQVHKLENGRLSLDTNSMFQTEELKKVLSEFERLEEEYGNILYTDLFFKEGCYPTSLRFTDVSKANLNAEVYAATMKRVYNWYRFGSSNPVYINHHVKQKIVASVVIRDVKYHKGRPTVNIEIIEDDAVTHTAKINFPFLIQSQKEIKKFTPAPICLTKVQVMLKDIGEKASKKITVGMIAKVANTLLVHQNTKVEKQVTLQTDDPDIQVMAINTPELGGIRFYEIRSNLVKAIPLNSERIGITDLINGFKLYRDQYSDLYDAVVGNEINVIKLTPDLFGHSFFLGKNTYEDIRTTLGARISKGHTTFSYLEGKGFKIRYISHKEGKAYYFIECVDTDNIFIFDMYFHLNNMEQEVQVIEPVKENFVSRLKRSLTSMFA